MVFSRVLRHYGMGYGEVMSLPVRVFWVLNSAIGRLLAEEDLRQLDVVAHASSGEGYRALRDALAAEMGVMFKAKKHLAIEDTERDEAGFAELKLLAAMA